MGDRRIYGEVQNKTNLRDLFLQIRRDVGEASSRDELTELHRRAGYLVTLTYSPSWKERFGDQTVELRSVADDEFARTARAINARAEDIGTAATYDDEWGERQ